MPEVVITLHIPIAPVPASRPRVGRYSTYYGVKYTKFRSEIFEWIEARTLPKFHGGVMAELTFAFAPRKHQKDTIGKYCLNRVDLDNLAKGVLDAFTGHLWDDDSQVIALFAHKICAEKAGIILSASGGF